MISILEKFIEDTARETEIFWKRCLAAQSSLNSLRLESDMNHDDAADIIVGVAGGFKWSLHGHRKTVDDWLNQMRNDRLCQADTYKDQSYASIIYDSEMLKLKPQVYSPTIENQELSRIDQGTGDVAKERKRPSLEAEPSEQKRSRIRSANVKNTMKTTAAEVNVRKETSAISIEYLPESPPVLEPSAQKNRRTDSTTPNKRRSVRRKRTTSTAIEDTPNDRSITIGDPDLSSPFLNGRDSAGFSSTWNSNDANMTHIEDSPSVSLDNLISAATIKLDSANSAEMESVLSLTDVVTPVAVENSRRKGYRINVDKLRYALNISHTGACYQMDDDRQFARLPFSTAIVLYREGCIVTPSDEVREDALRASNQMSEPHRRFATYVNRYLAASFADTPFRIVILGDKPTTVKNKAVDVALIGEQYEEPLRGAFTQAVVDLELDAYSLSEVKKWTEKIMDDLSRKNRHKLSMAMARCTESTAIQP